MSIFQRKVQSTREKSTFGFENYVVGFKSEITLFWEITTLTWKNGGISGLNTVPNLGQQNIYLKTEQIGTFKKTQLSQFGVDL